MAAALPYFAVSQTVENSPPVPPPGEEPAAAAGSSKAEERTYLFSDDTVSGGPAASPPVFAILRMILVLALVAAVIYLAVFFLRRLSRPQEEQNPHLRILASTHLGNGRFLHIVSMGTQTWLIGSGEGGINHIADIQDRELVDAMILEASKKKAEAPGPLPGFQALLKRFSGGIGREEQNRLENIRQRRERFKRF
ncbi:MAG: flagellar biosynthetic protein FliO [Spirochaetaceae bacterium]|nr:flagellar biosynthetic protein FliO [Spirochaetaceae bacterium]